MLPNVQVESRGHVQPQGMSYDRRMNTRVRTIFRVAVLKTAAHEGLCRITNISDSGARLQTTLSLITGERLQVSLADDISVSARVVWTNNGVCGVCFDAPIDCLEILHHCYETSQSPSYRAPRLSVLKPAIVCGESGMLPVTVHNVSQRGMKIVHDSSFKPGMRVKVLLDSGRERRGVVRWSTASNAGIWLIDQFAPEELSSTASL